jgi:hypothetical protein
MDAKTTLSMNENSDSILDFEPEMDFKNVRLFRILLGVSVSSILYTLINLWIQAYGAPNLKPIGLLSLLGVSLLFVMGAILLVLRRKPGWVISLFFQQFILLAIGLTWFDRLVIRQVFTFRSSSDFEGLILLILSAVSLVLLVNHDVRSLLKINQRLLIWTLILVTGLNITLMTFIFKS